jgi:cathepsin B
MIDEINAGGMWEASDDFVKDMTIGQAKMLAGTSLEPDPLYDPPERDWGLIQHFTAIPAQFDGRTQWPTCVNYIRDQGNCGSCWAFGAAESLSDRFCILNQTPVSLSPQWLVSCDKRNSGCNGGNNARAWAFMTTTGIPLEACDPYTSGNTKSSGTCPSACVDGSAPVFYKAKQVHSYTNPDSIRLAILEGGPIEASYKLYRDFYSYKSGIYVHTTGLGVGGHSIKIVGWGTDQGTDYWIVANSWGSRWGESGYFRIATNTCDISAKGVAGFPV